MSYNSKYSGQQVENLLDQVANGNVGGGGGITSETDPIFSASPAARITDENISSWNNKVDKVEGKQLSTEDFTTLLKQKLDDLSNYDDTAIQASVAQLRTDLDTLVSGDTTTAIKTFNEVIAFLDGLKDTEDLASIITSIEQQIAAKGTVTSITAGEGLTGGTITGEGTIALEELHSANKSITFLPFERNGLVVGSSLSLNKVPVTENSTVYSIDCDKNGRITYLSRTNQTESRTFYNIEEATKSLAGFMTAEDKTKLDGIDMTTKQDTLVSGTNIKTINGESILGRGNIVISGGSGDSSGGGSGAYAEVSHGTSDTTFTLTPNTFHVWDEVATLDLSFGEETSGVANEYLFQFTSGATATSLTVPDTVEWVDGTPTIEANKTYQVSIVNNIGLIVGV